MNESYHTSALCQTWECILMSILMSMRMHSHAHDYMRHNSFIWHTTPLLWFIPSFHYQKAAADTVPLECILTCMCVYVCVWVSLSENAFSCVCVYICVCVYMCVFVILMPMRMHSHVWHTADSNIGFNCVTCLICMCTIITHSWVRHDSSMRVTCRIYMSGTEHIPVYWCQNMILFLKNILSKKEI